MGDSFCYLVPAMEDPGGEYWNVRLKSAGITYGVGLGLLFLGVTMLWSGAWTPTATAMAGGSVIKDRAVTKRLAIVRFCIVYFLGASAVCLWRGIWYWADAWTGSLGLGSYWLTSLVGSTVAFLCGAGNSLLAPPAIFLTDGPANSPPPIGVTILSSYYSVILPYDKEPPKLSLMTRLTDIFGSFIFLPFAVVWFWRGTWMLFDNYLWGFTLENIDVHYSMLYCIIFAALSFVLTCEPSFSLLEGVLSNKIILGLFGRLRTYVLGESRVVEMESKDALIMNMALTHTQEFFTNDDVCYSFGHSCILESRLVHLGRIFGRLYPAFCCSISCHQSEHFDYNGLCIFHQCASKLIVLI